MSTLSTRKMAAALQQNIRNYHRMILENYSAKQINVMACIISHEMECLQCEDAALYQHVVNWSEDYQKYMKV